MPHDTAFDGQDMAAALFGTPVSRSKPLLWEYGRNEKFYVYPTGRDRSPTLAIRDGRWMLSQ